MQKDNSVTITKGIGIVLMVLAHSGFYSWGVAFIGMFHMPLFFILSGYCFKERYLDNMWQFVWRRTKGLYWPFVKWGLLFVLLHNIFFYLNIYNEHYGFLTNVSHLYTLRETVRNCVFTIMFFRSEELLGGYWFLPQLFWGAIIGFILLKAVHNPLIGGGYCNDSQCVMFALLSQYSIFKFEMA